MAKTLSIRLAEHAQKRADKPAILHGDEAITFGQLETRANRVAHGLRELDVGAGDRIAHLDRNDPVFFDLLFGAARVGAVLSPLNWRLAPQELVAILEDTTARVLVVGPSFLDAAVEIVGRLSNPPTMLVVGDSTRDDSWDRWVAAQSPEEVRSHGGEDDVVVQYYTSGTTGLPKGAMLRNRNLLAAGERLAEIVDVDEFSTIQAAMPLFHVSGSAPALLGIHSGCSTVLLSAPNPESLLGTLERHRVTHAVWVPAVIQVLLASPALASADVSRLEYVIYGGSPIGDDLLRQALAAFRCRFIQGYGMTETTGGCVLLLPDEHDPDGPKAHLLRAAGRAIPDHQLRIVDPETFDELPTGEIGEVWLRGPMIMAGYWRKPEATCETIRPDGWLRTGDAGYVDDEGYLYVHDRVKDMIVSGGENVYSAEVENALASHPDVVEGAVIGIPDPKWGETVRAVVVRATGSKATEESLIAHCRARLAKYKCPTSVEFVAELPRNATGKVLKFVLREPHWKGQARRVH